MRRLTDRVSAARRNDSGFTLIELLIVIIILGILAAIVVFSVQGITDRGDVAACKTSRKTVETAYEAFVANSPTGAKPANWADLYPEFVHDAAQPSGLTINWTSGVVTGSVAGCNS
ncbi:prepilin-type N-terminal cleavage/methylation domain-containing protein [Nocardioides albidus]|uniref:Prepilin-type N-terminal cleavage/methylation domain-containing protein n=1 Tax=Nocardioides albidus TaxID=1517589 RepID=A0A5C4WRJ8_9ACTN|nr:prepilin-type N-terminal cleavage/methylation domain-containing protein [Nocardioides albidus]TNM50216.1 prepilin-type N-terminal cleavage/methylation domain-containing protein [Nocardioides albidus]